MTGADLDWQEFADHCLTHDPLPDGFAQHLAEPLQVISYTNWLIGIDQSIMRSKFRLSGKQVQRGADHPCVLCIER